MRGINHVTLLGHLGHNPELRTTGSGHTLTELRLATNRRARSGDQWTDRTDWHRVTVWGKDAENACRFLVKGSPIAVEGRLATDTWQDKETGKNRSKTYVVAERVQFLGTPRRTGTSPAEGAAAGSTAPMAHDAPQPQYEQDDIPF